MGEDEKEKYFKKMSISFQQIKNKYLNSIFICNYECTQLVLNPSTLHFIRGEVSIWARANCSPPTPPTPQFAIFFQKKQWTPRKRKSKSTIIFKRGITIMHPGYKFKLDRVESKDNYYFISQWNKTFWHKIYKLIPNMISNPKSEKLK